MLLVERFAPFVNVSEEDEPEEAGMRSPPRLHWGREILEMKGRLHYS